MIPSSPTINTSLDNSYQRFLMIAFILGIIVFIIYAIYLYRRKSRGCDYMNSLYPKIEGYLRSINTADKECHGKLFDYYIKTAYNACSSDNDFVNICNLKAVIKQGVRCLDFEIYSVNDSPVVATSASDHNSIPFDSVMDTIRNYAFSGSTCPNPTDPIFIHLRCNSKNRKLYSKLTDVFKKNMDILLGPEYSYSSKGDILGKTPLLSLRNKVVIIMERANDVFLHNESLMEFVNMVSNSMFMRKYRYDGIKNAHDNQELIRFNRTGMTIVLPNKGNPDSRLCRESGCQMVAMRYQLSDEMLVNNTKYFSRKGYAFVLKPRNLRYIAIKSKVPPSRH